MGIVTGVVSNGYIQPTRAEWDRFRRNASWMRRLYLKQNSKIPGEVLRMISDNLPNGILCPGLQHLALTPKFHILPFCRLFLSPNLTEFSLRCFSFAGAEIPDEAVSSFTSTITELQVSSLQYLQISPGSSQIPSVRSVISDAVLRCGPPLTELSVSVPLSDAAVRHIMLLPNLVKWCTKDGPPSVSLMSLSDAFPRLRILQLLGEASLEWLPLFGAATRHTSSKQDTHTPSHRGPGQKLKTLDCFRVQVRVDAAFISPIMLFHGLVNLGLKSSCSGSGGCAFNLMDDNVAEITTALPRLRNALFGPPCSHNSCQTTVSSLVLLSTRCKDLVYLEIHFNTTNLCNDFEPIPENPHLRDLCALPRCRLQQLSVSNAPIWIGEEDIGPVAAGFLRIFPLLCHILGRTSTWVKISRELCNNR